MLIKVKILDEVNKFLKTIITTPHQNSTLGTHTAEFYQVLKEELIPLLQNHLQNKKKRVPNPLYENTNTLIPKPYEERVQKKYYIQ